MPTLVDLYCGRGGWSKPAIARGWRTIGYDVTDHGYPGTLVLASLPISIEQLQLWQPTLIVASPPCEQYARHHLPWISGPAPDLSQMEWCLSLIGRVGCPMLIECSKFAARHHPGARFAGSYALWGDVPALLPRPAAQKESRSGCCPDRRAEIPASLASWIVEVYE